ncbi:hypothetical protein LK996_03620 [Lysobacter sp. A6]|uniref:Uncharacterized protein n=1 Tax=Noviluteimonas lactosilytica TaxID=2888523 RepID=A0ABS8JF38_9GAMM|nr:hypothetical protein [Lysobacter lactosilyticus]MCC8362162.1 hypothetical protein [Lysobacter lactosilyticus]
MGSNLRLMRRISRMLGIGILAAASVAHAGKLSMVEGFAALRVTDDGTLAQGVRLAELERRYSERIAPGLATPGSLSNEDLAAAFEATDMLAFYALQGTQAQLERYTEAMSRVFDAMAAQRAVTPRHVGMMFDAFVSSRSFDAASRLLERYPVELLDRSVPRVVYAPHFEASRPAVLALQGDGTLLARNVDRSGEHIIVVVGCRASRNALDDINASRDLVDAFSRSRTYWLMPADRMTDASALQEWNARNPEQPAMFVYANAAWTNVAFGSMPHFQRFDGEHRIANVRGWERGGSAAQSAALFDPVE